MAVSNHGLVLTQSLLFQRIGHFRLCLESLSIFEEVCPLKPLSARDSALAFVAVSSLSVPYFRVAERGRRGISEDPSGLFRVRNSGRGPRVWLPVRGI